MSGHFESNAVSDVISYQPPKSLSFSCPAVKRKRFASHRSYVIKARYKRLDFGRWGATEQKSSISKQSERKF
jgi:hypothetical protein